MHTPCHDFVRFCRCLPTRPRYYVRTRQRTVYAYATQSGVFALFTFQSTWRLALPLARLPHRAVPSISAKAAKSNRQNSKNLSDFFVHFAIFAVFAQHFSLFCMVIHQFLTVLLRNFFLNGVFCVFLNILRAYYIITIRLA